MFDKLADLAKLVRQTTAMRAGISDEFEQLEQQRITSRSNAGLIVIEANGLGDVLSVRIDPTIADDCETIEELLPTAINDVQRRVAELQTSRIGNLAARLNLGAWKELFSLPENSSGS